MSAIADLYTGVRTILASTFAAPTYKRLVNPFVPELNDSLSLNRGYGFYLGPKSVYQKMGRYEGFSYDLVVLQSIVHRGTDRDITLREEAEIVLLEDQFTLIDYFRQNTNPISKVWTINYESDSGLEFVFADQAQYRIIQTTFKGIYSEGC